MKRIFTGAALVAVLTVFLATTAFAGGFKAKPWEYDPDHTGIVKAAWVTHAGLPDAGNSDHALFLQKNGLTPVNAAAGASIDGVSGIVLTELGFDYKVGGHCGAGAPRFNVQATDGFHFMGGCANATLTGSPAAGWNRVRIDPYNPAQAFPVLTPGATIISIDLVFDEGTDTGPDFTGSVYLDNIDVNGTLIGGPGNAK